jgi:hypothetical protein
MPQLLKLITIAPKPPTRSTGPCPFTAPSNCNTSPAGSWEYAILAYHKPSSKAPLRPTNQKSDSWELLRFMRFIVQTNLNQPHPSVVEKTILHPRAQVVMHSSNEKALKPPLAPTPLTPTE